MPTELEEVGYTLRINTGYALISEIARGFHIPWQYRSAADWYVLSVPLYYLSN